MHIEFKTKGKVIKKIFPPGKIVLGSTFWGSLHLFQISVLFHPRPPRKGFSGSLWWSDQRSALSSTSRCPQKVLPGCPSSWWSTIPALCPQHRSYPDFFTLSVTKFFLISTRWFMSFVLFASILKQGFRLTDKTERVPKEVLKKWKQFIFYLFPQRG